MPVNDELSDKELAVYLRRGTIHDFQVQAADRLEQQAAEIERLRAALAAQPQPDTEQVTAWLTEHRWRGRVMAAGGGYTWGIGDVLAAAAASAGSATPTDWEAEGRKAAAEGLTSDQAAERFGKLVAGSATPTENDDG